MTHSIVVTDRMELRGLWRDGLHVGVIAASINTAIYFLAVVLGVFSRLGWPSNGDDPLTIAPVLLASVAAGPFAVLVLRLIRRLTLRPLRAFVQTSGAVLLLSLLAPPVITGFTTPQIVVLSMMHVVVAIVVVRGICRAVQGERSLCTDS